MAFAGGSFRRRPGGRPGPALTGSKFKPNFCRVLTINPRQLSSSRIAGCALTPCGVGTISPSSFT